MNLVNIFVPALEILIIAIALYYFIAFFWHTRAMDLVLGLVAVLIIFAFVSWLQLPVLQKLMFYVLNVAVLAILIIFQPELRFALSKLSVKGKKYKEISEFDTFLEGMTQTVYKMSEEQTGAIILLENQDSLEEYASHAVRLDAHFSPELLESIFIPSSPLHDGAVIVRGTSVLSASAILPLASAETAQISRSMGTRHRAALGVSQITDALIIVVSEETGKVSIARDGIMTRGVKADRFKGIIRSIFTPPESKIEPAFNPKNWLKQWVS